jgi:hypothetical protein
MRAFLIWLALAGLLCAGCGGTPLGAGPGGGSTPVLLPALPQARGEVPQPEVLRGASSTEFGLTGSQTWQQSPQGDSYIPAAQPTALVVSPEEGSVGTGAAALKTAWAIYRFDGLLDERPVQFVTDVALAGPSEGATPVALKYFVGVSDNSLLRWEWHGPFAADASVPLNSVDLRQRMVDGAGTFFACIVVDSRGTTATPQNPQGRVAVQLSSVTVTGSANAVDTKPLFLEPSAMRIGSSLRGPSKLASALQPSQFPVVDWILASETPQHLGSQASLVRVFRQGPGDPAPVLVAQLSAAAVRFRDPLDLDPGIPSAKGGATYTYSLQAVNAAGAAGLASADRITVPILAPQQLQATQNSPGGASTQVSWQASDGAVTYHVLRGTVADGTDAAEIGTTGTPTVTFADSTAVPAFQYWYFVWVEGSGDGNPANGREAGSVSVNSSPAQGLRGVVLSLGTSAAGAGTQASPYLLTSGQSYQFQAADQQGTSRTNICSYSVEPPGAASFSGTPGLLSNIQAGAGDFTVTATLSYQGFVWTAVAYCRAS